MLRTHRHFSGRYPLSKRDISLIGLWLLSSIIVANFHLYTIILLLYYIYHKLYKANLCKPSVCKLVSLLKFTIFCISYKVSLITTIISNTYNCSESTEGASTIYLLTTEFLKCYVLTKFSHNIYESNHICFQYFFFLQLFSSSIFHFSFLFFSLFCSIILWSFLFLLSP